MDQFELGVYTKDSINEICWMSNLRWLENVKNLNFWKRYINLYKWWLIAHKCFFNSVEHKTHQLNKPGLNKKGKKNKIVIWLKVPTSERKAMGGEWEHNTERAKLPLWWKSSKKPVLSKFFINDIWIIIFIKFYLVLR